MGNRAVITTRKDLKDIGIYLHWNGGRDSVEGFLPRLSFPSSRSSFCFYNSSYSAACFFRLLQLALLTSVRQYTPSLAYDQG